MIVLRQSEANVLEHLRTGKTPQQVADVFGVARGNIVSIVARLCELSVIKRLGDGHYKVLIDSYQRTNRKNAGTRGDVLILSIPPEHERYIRSHYGIIPRRQMAKHLNVDKFTLNMMILQLRLARQESEVD